ncbi:hypothetical protein QBC40DRAFT_227858 [Triangularia verruculosa]|uniref:Uncharacterized protein n=1 Tax=Triangularia verruculosa TaxID=2587418 RepID=A0AAN7AVW7_9PEZI|nr:hypothetical protein QBC40DRAFT_227858 [Triangularia verruculosa]
MESAALTKAHDHARAASIATQTSDTTVAVTEHAQAAGEFANAAKGTTSIEALRMLTLLEQHHKRLSELLKLPLGLPSQNSNESDITEVDEKEVTDQDNTLPTVSSRASSHATGPTPAVKPIPTLSHQRYPGRNLSSSIANNLASARGIRSRYPSQPLAPSISIDQAPGSLEVHPRRESSTRGPKTPDSLDHPRKPGWVPPAIAEDRSNEPTKVEQSTSTPAPGEEGFSRFYSTFGTLINRLSAPLAFAGLPLISEESSVTSSQTSPVRALEPAPSRKRQWTAHPPTTTTATTEPDLKKIYSRAALRSLPRDPSAVDSFYFVPTSGHTVSYASILHHETKERRRLAASIHRDPNSLGDDDDEDDFVDAQEIQISAQLGARKPPSLLSSHSSKTRGVNDKDQLRNIIEELQLENASLKDALDRVSKRLHAFELNSQSSHLALAQSLRLQRPGSPMSASSGGGYGHLPPAGDEAALKKKNAELEEQLAEVTKRMSVMENDYDKLEQTVEKYRERWEKLKAGAKARREAQGGSSAAAGAVSDRADGGVDVSKR